MFSYKSMSLLTSRSMTRKAAYGEPMSTSITLQSAGRTCISCEHDCVDRRNAGNTVGKRWTLPVADRKSNNKLVYCLRHFSQGAYLRKNTAEPLTLPFGRGGVWHKDSAYKARRRSGSIKQRLPPTSTSAVASNASVGGDNLLEIC